MGFSSGGGTTYTTTTPQLDPAQKEQIALQNQLASTVVIPAMKQIISGGQEAYNLAAGGVTNAGQNLASMGTQVQETAGSTGESALRTGIAGLESLFGPQYEQQQLQAALMPAQMQYQQNLANQQAQFGGAGNLGSARSALAQTALAGQTQAQQQAAAANILGQIAQQRAGVGTNLAQIGQAGLGQALTGAQQQVNASRVPMDLYSQLAQIYYGVPGQSYSLGPYGSSGTQQSNTSQFGIKI